MTEAIASACRDSQIRYTDSKTSWGAPEEQSVVIHVGSKNRFADVLTFCETNTLPLIHAATGQNDCIPISPKCPIIIAPNCTLPIVRLIERALPEMQLLEQYGMRVQLDEIHQKSKRDIPSGTALAMAEKLRFPPQLIRAERRGISARAKHTIVFSAPDIKIGLYTETKSLRPYAVGALIIARMLVEGDPLPNGTHSLKDILQL